MLKITVFRNDQEVRGVRCDGHAGYDEAGKDIVCSAASVLMTNTLNSIETFTDDDFEGGVDDGFLEFKFTGAISDESKLLVRSLLLGLNCIQEEYGNKYIEITTEEV